MTTNEFVLNYIGKIKKVLENCDANGYSTYFNVSQSEYMQISTYIEVIEDLMKVAE